MSKLLQYTFALTTSVLVCGCAVQPASTASSATAIDATQEQPTNAASISSAAELERYLRVTPAAESPFTPLSPGAKTRFLASLRFGAKQLGGFDTTDITQELSDTEIRNLLAIFGRSSYAESLHGTIHPLHGAAVPTPIERRFNTFYLGGISDRDLPKVEYAAEQASRYTELVALAQRPDQRVDISEHDLSLLFRAAARMARDTGEAKYLYDLRRTLDEFERRGMATRARVRRLSDLLIAARRFDAANALASAFPSAGIDPLPPLITANGAPDNQPRVIQMQADGRRMVRKHINMQVPLRIIVVAGCHFSADAARAISAEPAVSKLFQSNAIWLASETESLRAVQDWNSEFPDQPMNVAWSNSEWSMLDSWGMPTFYVFQHGNLIDTWSGWPADTGMQTLRSHLRAANLLP